MSSAPSDRGRPAPTGGPVHATPRGAKPAAPRTSSHALLGEGGELVIEHEGREYRLRITQNRKLILTA